LVNGESIKVSESILRLRDWICVIVYLTGMLVFVLSTFTAHSSSFLLIDNCLSLITQNFNIIQLQILLFFALIVYILLLLVRWLIILSWILAFHEFNQMIILTLKQRLNCSNRFVESDLFSSNWLLNLLQLILSVLFKLLLNLYSIDGRALARAI